MDNNITEPKKKRGRGRPKKSEVASSKQRE